MAERISEQCLKSNPFSRISKHIHKKACVRLWIETSALPQLGCFYQFFNPVQQYFFKICTGFGNWQNIESGHRKRRIKNYSKIFNSKERKNVEIRVDEISNDILF